MGIAGLAIFTACFFMITLSTIIKIYFQVKRNQFCIDFLLRQWQESKAERLREAMEKSLENRI